MSQKFIAAAVLFAAWFALVVFFKAPMSDFITAIRDALIALGVFHVTLTNPKE